MPDGSEIGIEALRVSKPRLPPLDAYAAELAQAWELGRISNFGAVAERFEAICGEYTGLPRVRAVSSCDVGLTLAVRALGLMPGASVIVPSFTFPSTLHALLWNGLEPRFADVDPDTWCMTAETARAALDGSADAIVGTHAFMGACDVDGLTALSHDLMCVLLFDAAQAFASWIGSRHIGAYGDASVFSFSPTKVATCGEGGLAVFRDSHAAERFTLLRSYGSDTTYESRLVGLNGKLSELHAALGCQTVRLVEDTVATRAELVKRYRAGLGDIPGVRLQAVAPELRATPTQFVVDLGPARDRVARALRDHGIETRVYFRPLHAMGRFRHLPAARLPVTERLARTSLALPLHTSMDTDAVDHVCAVIGDLVARRPQRRGEVRTRHLG